MSAVVRNSRALACGHAGKLDCGKRSVQLLANCKSRTALNERARWRARASKADPGFELPLLQDETDRSLQFGRAVFGHTDWAAHKSSGRYTRHLASLPGSRILSALSRPMLTVLTTSTLETVYEFLQEGGRLPPWCGSISVQSFDVFNLTSFALSLLLVFRTNASYDRWLEARGIWGGVVIHTRDIIRLCLPKMKDDEAGLQEMLRRWTTAFPYTLKCHLVEGTSLQQELQDILLPDEIERLKAAQHPPNYVIGMIDEIISASASGAHELLSTDKNLAFFGQAVGSCERIFKTPIPLSWTRHTSRSLTIWLLVLPLSLYHMSGIAAVAATMAIAFLLLGIDEIGVQIEEPFAILPLDHFCRIIQSSIEEMYTTRRERIAMVSECRPKSSNKSNNHRGRVEVHSS